MAGTFSSTAHWRDSARPARFFMLDARAAFPVFIFLLHIRLWTALLVLATALFFGAIEKFGFTVPVFLRWLRCFLAGNLKSSKYWWQ